MYLAVCDDNREELDAVLSLLGCMTALTNLNGWNLRKPPPCASITGEPMRGPERRSGR